MVCIYCKQEKLQRSFNREHVLPRCLGTFLRSPTLNCVCKACNQAFGDHLEIALGRDSFEALLRFQHRLKPLKEVASLRSRNMMATFDVDGPCRGARVVFQADDRGVVIDLVDQAGIPFKHAGLVYVTLEELRVLETPIKPHIVPKKRINFIYKSTDNLHEMVRHLERLGMTFTNKDSYDAFDIPHLDHAKVEVHYREGRRIQRALSKIALNYMALQMGPAFTLNSDFDSIRSFIVNGTALRFPSLYLSSSEPRQLSDTVDSSSEHHVVSLDWDGSPSRIAVTMEFFGGRQYKVVMTDNYHGLFRTDLARAHFFDLQRRTISEMVRPKIILP